MTPGARVAAAISILNAIRDGQAAEQALTSWARGSRFAGSKDRAAIRDHVFGVLRRNRSAGFAGGGETPRARMAGMLALQGQELSALFTGAGHAPAPLSDEELPSAEVPADLGTLWDLPDWLVPAFQDSLGEEAAQIAKALQDRAPVFLRVNAAKADVAKAADLLAGEGVETTANPLCATALTVTEGARKIRQTRAYQDGVVELQDAASQAVVAALPDAPRVLDYCAGGGGKALALAAQPDREVFAHDHDPARMRDLPERAARAGARVSLLEGAAVADAAPFDLVLCDVPCSGSGAWRRAPQGKWLLTPERLAALNAVQDQILGTVTTLVAPGGTLAYATCSVLKSENEDRIAAFLGAHPDWSCTFEQRFAVNADGDGFYTAHLKRK